MSDGEDNEGEGGCLEGSGHCRLGGILGVKLWRLRVEMLRWQCLDRGVYVKENWKSGRGYSYGYGQGTGAHIEAAQASVQPFGPRWRCGGVLHIQGHKFK